jgi:hypothetical protein
MMEISPMHWLDPDYLPATKGQVKQLLINAHGEADGFILSDGTEVHFPPHMGAEIEARIAPGDEVTIRGAKPRSADLIAAVAIDTASGHRIDDKGPRGDEEGDGNEPAKPEHEPMEHEAAVVRALHGPKGEVRGALFEDGITVRFPKHEADWISELIVPGAVFAVRGRGLKIAAGTVIDAREAGSSVQDLQHLKKKPQPVDETCT